MTRSLSIIKKILDIQPIPGADAIEVATIGGWKVVVKKGEYRIGEMGIYFEIDSWIPEELAPFLFKGKEYSGVKGARLRTVKLRGQISQGLLLPVSLLAGYEPKAGTMKYELSARSENCDLTEYLGIVLYEPPLPAQLAGLAKGLFPSYGRKTNQERCQNLIDEIQRAYDSDTKFEVSVKLDGSSMSVGYHNFKVDVCSRNLSLKLDQVGNAFVDMAVKNGMIYPPVKYDDIMISGELMGPGIQGNRENLNSTQFFVFDVYDVKEGRYMTTDERLQVVLHKGLESVPVIHYCTTLRELGLDTVEKILVYAEGPSLNNKTREGLVFKSQDGEFSFKAISNSFLLKEK